MTKEDLDKLGVVFIGTKLHPNKFFIPLAGEVLLSEPYRMDVIFECIYNSGYNAGLEQGAENKIKEFKRFLNIND